MIMTFNHLTIIPKNSRMILRLAPYRVIRNNACTITTRNRKETDDCKKNRKECLGKKAQSKKVRSAQLYNLLFA